MPGLSNDKQYHVLQDKLAICKRTNHTYCLSVNVSKLTSVCECGRNYRYNPLKDRCEGYLKFAN